MRGKFMTPRIRDLAIRQPEATCFPGMFASCLRGTRGLLWVQIDEATLTRLERGEREPSGRFLAHVKVFLQGEQAGRSARRRIESTEDCRRYRWVRTSDYIAMLML
jgi:hypothetical protein